MKGHKIVTLTLCMFMISPVSARPCKKPISWPHIQTWIQARLNTEKLSPPPGSSKCWPKTAPTQAMSKLIQNYLWRMVHAQNLAETFERSLSDQQLAFIEYLKNICQTQFPKRCYKPYHHRLDLRAQYPAPSIEW